MSGEKILVVDDNRQIADYLANNLLPALGYEPMVAYDGKTAMQIINSQALDLMLLDLELTDTSGLDILRRLVSEKRQVPTILVTAHGSEEIVVDAFRLGVQDYLIKPVDADRLEMAIGRALTENRLRRKTEQLTAQLKEQVSWLTILQKVGQSVTSTLELDEVLRRIVEAGVQLTNAEEGFLSLLDDSSEELYLRAVKNIDQNKIKTLHLPVRDSLIGTVIRTRRPLRTAQALKDAPLKVSTGFLVFSLLHVPILSRGKPVGVLSVVNHSVKRSFRETDEALLSSLADYAAVAIENANLYQRAQGEIDERKRIEVALRESEERYALAVRGANDGVWDWDLKTNHIYYSPRWKAMLGYREEEVGSDPLEWLRRVHPDDIQRVKMDISSHLRGQTPHLETEHRIQHKDGSYRWMLSRGQSVWDEQMVATRLAGSLTDITDRKSSEEKLVRDALYDTLTGLPNRALLFSRLKHAIQRKRRQRDYDFAVLFLDLDRFKDINDTLGHMMGDQLLINIAHVLQSGVRESDTVARLGGDEFVILLEEIHDISAATRAANWIQQKLSLSFLLPNHDVVISTSIGIVQGHWNYHRPEEILRDADIAMYVAKERGKARYEIFTPDMRTRVLERFALETQLRQALERQELTIFYQPITDLNTGCVNGLEALVRWRHPERGLIAPLELLCMTEENALALLIDRWALTTACTQMHVWQQMFPQLPPLSIHINISPQQMVQADLEDAVREGLEASSLPAACLSLEMTEAVVMEMGDEDSELLSRLRAQGIHICLDNFGVGAAPLTRLAELPIDSLKFGAGFVEKLNDPAQHRIIQAMIQLSRDLNLIPTAEGVDTLDEMTHLNRLGCVAGQGLAICPPMERDELEDLLMKVSTGKNPLAPR